MISIINETRSATISCRECPKHRTRRVINNDDPLRYLFAKHPPTDLITVDEVEKLLNRKRDTLYRWAKNGTFPPPVKHNWKILGWRRDSYENWLSSKTERP